MNFREWFDENLNEYAKDIANHGADAGYPSITYYSDCVEVYNQFESEIWNMMVEDAEDFGYKNVGEFVSTFNRSDMLDDPDRAKNLFLWYACEKVAHEKY